jgi:hypothetical protein
MVVLLKGNLSGPNSAVHDLKHKNEGETHCSGGLK